MDVKMHYAITKTHAIGMKMDRAFMETLRQDLKTRRADLKTHGRVLKTVKARV